MLAPIPELAGDLRVTAVQCAMLERELNRPACTIIFIIQ
jgi:hypothetical protein